VADLARLVRATMRLRPDAIIVGEVRGREALDMLKAWNTGHPGGLTTVHANGARAALSRLDQLVQEAGVPSQPELLADAVDVIVFIQHRTIQQLVRVHGYDATARTFELEQLAAPTQEEICHGSDPS
jgi:type IV secretion system protein VirB11